MVSLVLTNQQNSGELKNNTRILKITSQRPKTKGSKKIYGLNACVIILKIILITILSSVKYVSGTVLRV